MFHSGFAAPQCLSFWYPSSTDYSRKQKYQYIKKKLICYYCIMICHILLWRYLAGSLHHWLHLWQCNISWLMARDFSVLATQAQLELRFQHKGKRSASYMFACQKATGCWAFLMCGMLCRIEQSHAWHMFWNRVCSYTC